MQLNMPITYFAIGLHIVENVSTHVCESTQAEYVGML